MKIWQELGISGGTAIIVLIAMYFIIKWAVRNAIIEAEESLYKRKYGKELPGSSEEAEENESDEG